MADETAWLIERAISDRPEVKSPAEYLVVSGGFDEHSPRRASGVLGWTHSPQHALRFSRKIDAAMFAAGVRAMQDQIPHGETLTGMRNGDPHAHITDHMWCEQRERDDRLDRQVEDIRNSANNV